MKMECFKFGAILLLSIFIFEVNGYDEFEKTCVVAHNELRTLHGAQGLSWSEELGTEAQKWCEELALKDELKHDNKSMDTKNQGENLAAIVVVNPESEGPSPDTCAMVVREWYSEEKNYNYQAGMAKSPGMPIKHFAQVVWNSTFEIGVGTARSTVHGDIICARYSPRGAEGGPAQFKNNVFVKQSINPFAADSTLGNMTSPVIRKCGNAFVLKTKPCVNNYNGGGGYGGEGGGGYKGSLSCGVGKTSRVVGGKKAKPSEFPWQVGFRWQSEYGHTNIFCGGTLLDKKWVVSAAHCFQGEKDPSMELKVLLGEFDTQNKDGNEVIAPVKKVINHPEYNTQTMDNDIAMILLDNEVEFNDNMKPCCLPDRSVNFGPGKRCTVTGFGAIREGGPQATTLMKVVVPLISKTKCAKSYGSISDKKLCAGYDRGQKDSCQGDSGGPLACMKGGKFFLTGVVSYGSGCARPGFPGVYVNVKNFMEWIETTKNSVE